MTHTDNPGPGGVCGGKRAEALLCRNIEKHRDRIQEFIASPSLPAALGDPKTQDDWEFAEIVQVASAIGLLLKYVSEQPASAGYEPYLSGKGINPIIARGFALLAVKRGNRIAAEQQRRASVMGACLDARSCATDHFSRSPQS